MQEIIEKSKINLNLGKDKTTINSRRGCGWTTVATMLRSQSMLLRATKGQINNEDNGNNARYWELLRPLLFAVRYSWDIYGIFMEYSWGIHMYRVCVGNVSGMCRECVERNGMRLGSYSNFVREKCQCAWIKSNYWSGLVCLTWASICMKRSPKLIDHTSIHWLRNTGSSEKVFANESRMVACVCHNLT